MIVAFIPSPCRCTNPRRSGGHRAAPGSPSPAGCRPASLARPPFQTPDQAGTATWEPAASSTSTAAWAVRGWKWLLSVSGHRLTGGRPLLETVDQRARLSLDLLLTLAAELGQQPPSARREQGERGG